MSGAAVVADDGFGVGPFAASDGNYVAAHVSLHQLNGVSEMRGRSSPQALGSFQRITLRVSSPPGAGARLPKITPISGAYSFTERYSSPVRCELRYQPAPISKPVRRWMIR